MKVLFLFPYPIGESPSQRFRFEQYLERLTTSGITYDLEPFWGRRSWDNLYRRGGVGQKMLGFLSGTVRRLKVMFRISAYDYIFIHREVLPLGPPLLEWYIARVIRKRIIYDFDDAIWLPNTSLENKIAAAFKWHSKVKTICRWSHKVSCGNAYLAEFAATSGVTTVVNPSTIDTVVLHNPLRHSNSHPDGLIRVGWTGTHSTLKYLDLLIPVFRQLEADYPNFRLVVIADKQPDIALGSLDFVPWRKETEIDDLMKLDIGLMPLTDDIWSRGKCGFKALQYMALEKPALVSPVGVNTSIVDHGITGFLCNGPDEWLEHLRQLITTPELRQKIGKLGRKKVIDCYSVSSNSSVFLSLFE